MLPSLNTSSTSANLPRVHELTRSSPDRDFSIGLRSSLYFHVGLALLVFFKSLVFPGKPLHYTPTLRVDIVGLPDDLKKDLAQIRPSQQQQELSEKLKKATEAAESIKPVAPTIKKTELTPAEPNERILNPKKLPSSGSADVSKKNQSALARIKALEKLGNAEDALIRGNAISKGTSLSGDAKESSEENYLDLLRNQLQQNWALPVWLARQKLSAQVQIFLDQQGRLRNFRIIKPSGNAQFDEAVKRSVQESQPFPPPPAHIASALLGHGVLIGFPL